MDFFEDIFDAIVGWVVDLAGEEIAAVVGSAIIGAVSGAVVGAAVAAIKGEDIGDGALEGAAYGALTMGLASTVGQITGTASAAEQLEGMGIPLKDKSKSIETQTTGQEAIPSPATGGGSSDIVKNKVSTSSTTPITTPKVPGGTKEKMSDAKALIYSGAAQGLASGGLAALGATAAADTDAEAAAATVAANAATVEREYEISKEKIADNQPASYKLPTSNITVPSATDWWTDKFNLDSTTQGILS